MSLGVAMRMLQDGEDQNLSHLLTSMALPMYCQKLTSAPAEADTCCKMMTTLMQASDARQRKLLASEITEGGTVPHLLLLATRLC